MYLKKSNCHALDLFLQVSHFKEYIPKAFPSGDDLILDAEVLLIDTKTGVPLPFGSLGKHKVNLYNNTRVNLPFETIDKIANAGQTMPSQVKPSRASPGQARSSQAEPN